jgi:hypothetical protein
MRWSFQDNSWPSSRVADFSWGMHLVQQICNTYTKFATHTRGKIQGYPKNVASPHRDGHMLEHFFTFRALKISFLVSPFIFHHALTI